MYSMDIFQAAKTDNVARIQELIDAGIDVNRPDTYGWSPMHCAADNASFASIQTLIAAGGNVNQRTNPLMPWLSGRTPLELMLGDNREFDEPHYFSFQAMVALIAAGANVTKQYINGHNLLHIAAQHGHLPHSPKIYCRWC